MLYVVMFFVGILVVSFLIKVLPKSFTVPSLTHWIVRLIPKEWIVKEYPQINAEVISAQESVAADKENCGSVPSIISYAQYHFLDEDLVPVSEIAALFGVDDSTIMQYTTTIKWGVAPSLIRIGDDYFCRRIDLDRCLKIRNKEGAKRYGISRVGEEYLKGTKGEASSAIKGPPSKPAWSAASKPKPFFEKAKFLWLIREYGTYREHGYKSWNKFSKGHLEISRSQADYLVKTYEWAMQFSPEIQKKIDNLGCAKAQMLVGLTAQNIELFIERAVQTQTDLFRIYMRKYWTQNDKIAFRGHPKTSS